MPTDRQFSGYTGVSGYFKKAAHNKVLNPKMINKKIKTNEYM